MILIARILHLNPFGELIQVKFNSPPPFKPEIFLIGVDLANSALKCSSNSEIALKTYKIHQCDRCVIAILLTKKKIRSPNSIWQFFHRYRFTVVATIRQYLYLYKKY